MVRKAYNFKLVMSQLNLVMLCYSKLLILLPNKSIYDIKSIWPTV